MGPVWNPHHADPGILVAFLGLLNQRGLKKLLSQRHVRRRPPAILRQTFESTVLQGFETSPDMKYPFWLRQKDCNQHEARCFMLAPGQANLQVSSHQLGTLEGGLYRSHITRLHLYKLSMSLMWGYPPGNYSSGGVTESRHA